MRRLVKRAAFFVVEANRPPPSRDFEVKLLPTHDLDYQSNRIE
jgi:hypothetical protein